MSLLETALKHRGEIVHVHPFYGWGWTSNGSDTIPTPEAFRMRVSDFWEWRGETRGGFGYIEEPNHSLDRLWVVFSTRHVGEFDFDDHVDPAGGFNVTIGEGEPTQAADEWPVSPQKRMHGWADILSEQRGCELCKRAESTEYICET
jgi:hypothetical protein